MFVDHQPLIADFAHRSPENLYRVFQFVQTTIRRPFYTVPGVLQDLKHTGVSKYLTGRQQNALGYYWENKETIYERLYSNLAIQHKFWFCCQLPGLHLVKGGFILQLVLGTAGCVDRHDTAQLGLPKTYWETPKRNMTKLYRKILVYLQFTGILGCGNLWNFWCNHVAHLYPRKLPNAEYVSWLHVEGICL